MQDGHVDILTGHIVGLELGLTLVCMSDTSLLLKAPGHIIIGCSVVVNCLQAPLDSRFLHGGEQVLDLCWSPVGSRWILLG